MSEARFSFHVSFQLAALALTIKRRHFVEGKKQIVGLSNCTKKFGDIKLKLNINLDKNLLRDMQYLGSINGIDFHNMTIVMSKIKNVQFYCTKFLSQLCLSHSPV